MLLSGLENTSHNNEDFKKTYNEESNKRYLFKIDFQDPKTLYHLHNGLLFLTEKMERVQ